MILTKKMNNKGQTTINLVWVVVIAVVLIIILGVFVFVNHQIRTNLSVDLDIGQVNLKNVTEDTFGVWDDAVIGNADKWGVFLLFGCVLAMLCVAYFLQGKYSRFLIPVEILILIVVHIVSVYISRIYNIYITDVNILSSTYVDVLPKSSKFILNLPGIVDFVGVLMIVINHIRLKKRDKGDLNVYGY